MTKFKNQDFRFQQDSYRIRHSACRLRPHRGRVGGTPTEFDTQPVAIDCTEKESAGHLQNPTLSLSLETAQRKSRARPPPPPGDQKRDAEGRSPAPPHSLLLSCGVLWWEGDGYRGNGENPGCAKRYANKTVHKLNRRVSEQADFVLGSLKF